VPPGEGIPAKQEVASPVNSECVTSDDGWTSGAARMKAMPMPKEVIELLNHSFQYARFQKFTQSFNVAAQNRLYSQTTKDIANNLYIVSPKAYCMLRQLLPFPAESRLPDFNRGPRQVLRTNLDIVECIPDILSEYF
jgi:hypothetical protein